MIQRDKIEELLKAPVEERRRILRLLQESLSKKDEQSLPSSELDSSAAQWLRSMAGRYCGGPGDTATRADDILRAEIDKRGGLTNK